MARSQFIPVALALMLVFATSLPAARASCTCKNTSKKDIVIVPVDASIHVNIEVKAGATVQVPSTHQHCHLKNKESGHTMGPFTLPDNQVIAVVDAKVSGKVDVWVAGLLSGLLHLVLNICVSL